MNTTEIISFPAPNLDNIGGCKTFQFIPEKEVAWIPRFPFYEVTDAVVLVQDAAWRTGYSTFKQLSFSEKMEENSQGSYYFTEIKGFYPKLTAEQLKLFGIMKSLQFLLIVEDNNKFKRLVGTPEEPLQFAFDQQTGKQVGDINGYNFRFFGPHAEPSPFYNPAT